MNSLLDNPIWEALSSYHRQHNEGDSRLKYFYQAISPFVAMEKWDDADQLYLEQHVPAGRNFFHIIANPIQLPASCSVVFSLPLYQMVCKELHPFNAGQLLNIRSLGQKDVQQMIELTALTKPGPFNQRTIEFGNYTGLFDKKRLAAMAGERLKVKGYTEVSAICTHPDYIGKGYGATLLSLACTRIIQEGNQPFLHVRHDNERAIKLYQEAGFEIRSEMNFVIFRKKKE